MQIKNEERSRTVKMLPAKGILSDDIRDHSNDPFFIKKAEAAKMKVDKIGFPKAFLSNK